MRNLKGRMSAAVQQLVHMWVWQLEQTCCVFWQVVTKQRKGREERLPKESKEVGKRRDKTEIETNR